MLQGSGSSNQFGAIPPERFADRASERMCRDLRSMQLFAEKVLAHRLNKDPNQFRSYGFHEPNTEEGRQVYTVVDEQLYYFLPKLSLEAVHRLMRQIPALVAQEQRFGPPIRQVILVGESSTVSDREKLQEAVNNYQPQRIDTRLPAPILPEPGAAAGSVLLDPSRFETNLPEPNQFAAGFTEAVEASSLMASGANPLMSGNVPSGNVPSSSVPLTTLPSQPSQVLPLTLRLSYINEDSYWDPRQDDLTVPPEGLMHDRAGQISAWLQKHPGPANFNLESVVEPRTALQSPATQLQSPELAVPELSLELSPELAVPEAVATPGVPETRVDRRDRRSSDWFKTGPLANAWPFLVLLGALGALLWLGQWGRNQLVNTANEYGADAPPPPNALPGANSASSFTTTRTNTTVSTNTAANTAAANNRTASVNNNAGATRQVVVTNTTATVSQPQLPPVGFWVRAPQPHDGVNLRTGPGMENRKIRGIPNGYWVVDEGRSIGNWREVSFQGQRGWVYRSFIR